MVELVVRLVVVVVRLVVVVPRDRFGRDDCILVCISHVCTLVLTCGGGGGEAGGGGRGAKPGEGWA